MREIVMDTETTGIDPFDREGRHRIVEIGALELENHVPTGRTYHQYINPERDMPAEAFAVHGLGNDFLADKSLFADIARDFLSFIGDAKLVIHNAPFDMKFMNAEFEWANLPRLKMDQAIDTLDMARRRFPGAQNTLDGLCRRFGVDNTNRELHGALLDSELLAEVYLHLMGGRQPGLTLVADSVGGTGANKGSGVGVSADWRAPARPAALASKITAEEAEAHAAFIAEMGDEAVWKQ